MIDAALAWIFKGWQEDSFDRGGLRRRARDARHTTRARATDRDQEREWIAGLRAGSLEIFDVVFRAYARRLQQFARVWVPPDVAEDIVQDVLFEVWQRGADLHPHQDNLTGYLFASVRNRTLNYLRHAQTVQGVEEAGMWETPLGMGTGPRHPDVDMTAEDIRGAVASALATLSELQRAALMLRSITLLAHPGLLFRRTFSPITAASSIIISPILILAPRISVAAKEEWNCILVVVLHSSSRDTIRRWTI